MKKYKKLIMGFIAVIVVIIVAGSSIFYLNKNRETGEKKKDSPFLVGFSIHFLQDDYTVNVVNSFESTMKASGIKTIIVNANGDSKKQVADIEELINQGVDAIGICPLDEAAVRNSLVKAQSQGIKVVTITEIPGVAADAVIYGREYENGFGSGEVLKEALKGQKDAEVAVLDFPYDIERTKERIKGFQDALEGSGITVTAQGRPGSNEEAMDYVKELLEANPNIKGIFGSYSNNVIGAGAACKALGRTDVKVVGVDADILAIKLIQEGWIEAAAAQFPKKHGTYCAYAIMNNLYGEPIKKTYTAPYLIVNKNNARNAAKVLWDKEL